MWITNGPDADVLVVYAKVRKGIFYVINYLKKTSNN